MQRFNYGRTATMHNLLFCVSCSDRSKHLLYGILCTDKAKKQKQKQRTLDIKLPNHSALLTLIKQIIHCSVPLLHIPLQSKLTVPQAFIPETQDLRLDPQVSSLESRKLNNELVA